MDHHHKLSGTMPVLTVLSTGTGIKSQNYLCLDIHGRRQRHPQGHVPGQKRTEVQEVKDNSNPATIQSNVIGVYHTISSLRQNAAAALD